MAIAGPELKGLETRGDIQLALKDAGEKLVVMFFYASWCTPCLRIAPFVKELPGNYTNAAFYIVNVDENVDGAEYYNIKAMPTFILFKNGVKIERLQGADQDKLKGIVDKHYVPEQL